MENNLSKKKNSGYWIKKMIAELSNVPNEDLIESKVRHKTENELVVEVVTKFYKLLVCTTYLKQEVYAFYVERKSYRKIESAYSINPSYLKNIIYLEGKKIKSDLGFNPYELFVEGMLENDEKLCKGLINALDYLLDSNSERIPQVEKKVDKKTILGQLAFDLNKVSEIDRIHNANISQKDFIDIVHALRGLSNPYQDFLIKSLDSKDLGYIDYLLSRDDKELTEQDVIRKNYIKESWLLNKQ